MSKWEMVKLSEAFHLQMGKTPSRSNLSYWNGGSHKWVSIADMSLAEKYLLQTKERITDLGVTESGIKVVPKNTVIMSFKLSIGRTCIVPEDMYTNEAIMAFVDKGKYEVDTDYLFHLLRGRDWSVGTNKAVMGVTLNKATLGSVKIPLPPLEIQKQIAQTLDAAADLLTMRKRQLAELDDLIKSIFYEMFGDQDACPHERTTCRLGDVAEIVSGITKGRKLKDSNTTSVPYMRVANVQDGHLVLSEITYIDASDSEIGRYRLNNGDLLLTEGGDPDKLGRCAIWNGEIPTCIHQNHIFRVRLNKELLIPEYASFLIGSSYGKKYFLKAAKQTTGIATINSKQLSSFPMVLPDINRQSRFAEAVKQVEEQKALVKKAIDETQHLFDSLMSEFFV